MILGLMMRKSKYVNLQDNNREVIQMLPRSFKNTTMKKKSGVDLGELEKALDRVLATETPESMQKWLDKQRGSNELRQLFRQISNCYADTWLDIGVEMIQGEVIQAMTEDVFVEVVIKLRDDFWSQQNNTK